MGVVLCSDDGEQQQPPLLVEAERKNDEYVRQLELLLERSLFDRGLVLPSQPNQGIKIGCRVKETASPSRRRVKAETASPPRRWVGRFVQPMSLPRLFQRDKEEAAPSPARR